MAGYVSGGLGHGDYVFATLLFPYTLLSSILRQVIFHPRFGDSPFDLIFFGSAILQFPVYGLILSLVSRKALVGVVIGIVHLVVVALSFWLANKTGFL